MAAPNFLTPAQYGAKAAEASAATQAIYDTIATKRDFVAGEVEARGYVSAQGKTAMQIQTEQIGELQAQNKKQQVAEAADWDRLSIVLGQDLAGYAERQRAVSAKIAEDSAVSIFDDPLTALANAFTLPWDQQELAGIKSGIQITSDAMNAVNSHVQASAQTADAIKTRVTEASIADTTARLAHEANIQAADARIAALKSGADGVTAVMNMDHQQLNAYMNQKSLENQAEHLKMAKESHARTKEQFDLQMEKYKDEQQAEKVQMQMINLARLEDGMAPLDITGLKRYKATSAKLLDKWLERGVLLAGDKKAKVMHGETIPERFEYQTATGWTPKTEAQRTIMEMQFAALKSATEGGSKDKAVIATSADKIFRDDVKNKLANIKTSDQTNPFVAQSYSTIGDSAVGKTTLWQKFIAPTVSEANAKQPVDPQRVVTVMADAVMKREVAPAVAAAFISDIYKRSAALNNELNKMYKISGIEQTSYNTRISVGGVTEIGAFMGGKVNLDMTDPVAVQNALIKKVVGNLGVASLIPEVSVDTAALTGVGQQAINPAITFQSRVPK